MSEFGKFLDMLKMLGIPHSIHWAPGNNGTDESTKIHQKILQDGGFSLTALALTGIVIGDEMLVFSTGQAHWSDENTGHGPSGAFLYRYNMKTGERTHRTHRTTMNGKFNGLAALAVQHHVAELL